MKSEAEKKLIAAEIAANVHKQLVIEEAKRFTKNIVEKLFFLRTLCL